MNVLFFPIFALVIAGLHIILEKKHRTAEKVLEHLLLYLLIFSTGFGGIFAFLGHSLRAAEVARFIGWMPGSPFQFEVAVANLAFGVLGLLCYFYRGNFWTATIIGSAVFGWGAAWGHIREIMLYKNYAPGNAGAILYLDIFMPIILIGLLMAYNKVSKKKKKGR